MQVILLKVHGTKLLLKQFRTVFVRQGLRLTARTAFDVDFEPKDELPLNLLTEFQKRCIAEVSGQSLNDFYDVDDNLPVERSPLDLCVPLQKQISELQDISDDSTDELEPSDLQDGRNKILTYKEASAKAHGDTEAMNMYFHCLTYIFKMLLTRPKDAKLSIVICNIVLCKKWYKFLNDENNDVWRLHCIRKLAEEALKSDLLSSVPTYKAKLRAFYHAWNPNDCSRNIYIKPNGFTLHRNPVAQSTDASRGKIGFRHGRHAWEVIWEGPLGTVAVIGIATKDAPLQCHGYVALLGSDEQSWGWNLVDNHLLHNGDAQGNYPLLNNAPKYQVGERIRVILDCDDNTLSFEKNYEFLGVAFRGLPDKKLYPTVSAVYGNTEVSMVYLGPPLDG
ncbi:spry domain containing socs box protein [Holotrichia oblita]|uniref:Spry domain containing socs box protein n=1 Tax=Holotrichia oblita TaxID=644536 RepID=A0ACB9TFJ6_HOLOL|nr:spry domain containing socs box protein [Holotrichia oblita]